VDERARDQQASPHPAREPTRLRSRLRRQVKGLEQLVRAGRGVMTCHPEVAAVVDEQLARREEPIEVHLLRRKADQHPRMEVGDGVVSEDEDPSSGRTDEAGDRGDRGRLPCAVRPEQAEEASIGHVQLERVERMRTVRVDLRQPVDAECGRGRCAHRRDARDRARRSSRGTRGPATVRRA
jgi:hypothetical protein